MSTKNTLINVSSPDVELQTRVFAGLARLDSLQAALIGTEHYPHTMNRFLSFGRQYHNTILKCRDAATSTNPISVSNGLISDFFVEVEGFTLKSDINEALEAFSFLRAELVRMVRVVHVHVRSPLEHNQGRRIALSLLHSSIVSKNSEIWFTFDCFDISSIEKEILEHMRSCS